MEEELKKFGAVEAEGKLLSKNVSILYLFEGNFVNRAQLTLVHAHHLKIVRKKYVYMSI